jgi:hypothetical protein
LFSLAAIIRSGAPVVEFVKCPCCAGHEAISAEAADRLAGMIYNSMSGWPEDSPLKCELMNIRNAILNTQERVDPLLR